LRGIILETKPIVPRGCGTVEISLFASLNSLKLLGIITPLDPVCVKRRAESQRKLP